MPDIRVLKCNNKYKTKLLTKFSNVSVERNSFDNSVRAINK